MATDLVTLLQKALLKQQLSLDPLRKPAKPVADFADRLRYISSLLMDDGHEDEEASLLPPESCEQLLSELSTLISSSSDDSSPTSSNSSSLGSPAPPVGLGSVSPGPLGQGLGPPEALGPSEGLGPAVGLGPAEGLGPEAGLGHPAAAAEEQEQEVESLLFSCAQAVAAKDVARVYSIVERLHEMVPPTSAWGLRERLVLFFVEALIARLTGASEVWRPPTAPPPLKDVARVCGGRLPTVAAAHFFHNRMILEHIGGARRIHVIDFGMNRGVQWVCLLTHLARRPQGPPEWLRITGVDVPHCAAAMSQARAKLAEHAASVGVRLQVSTVPAAAWEAAPLVPRHAADELLIVNCCMRLRTLRDDGVAAPDSPRGLLLRRIHSLSPFLFVISDSTADLSGPFFLSRFATALRYYGAAAEYMSTFVGRGGGAAKADGGACAGFDGGGEADEEVAARMLRKKVMNVVACEGVERYERPISYQRWDTRLRRTGFRPARLSEELYGKMQGLLGQYGAAAGSAVGTARDKEWMIVGWKDVPLYAMSAWATA